jgi:hypothetical protein
MRTRGSKLLQLAEMDPQLIGEEDQEEDDEEEEGEEEDEGSSRAPSPKFLRCVIQS